ncbi:MAG: hypothetical protein FWD31_10860 [Planctomycetaceae bacterium]|nr:hypothetical protein [Planctomycetaceae bacterium]
MIRCYYIRETLDTVAKAGRRRAIGCGGVWYGWMLFALIAITIKEPGVWLRAPMFLYGCCAVLWCAMGYFCHRLLGNVEKTTLQHAGDEITLDDNEIRLVAVDEKQIALPREGLRVQGGYIAAGSVIYTIWNPKFSEDKIVLTTNMENARELVETIRSGAWDTGD